MKRWVLTLLGVLGLALSHGAATVAHAEPPATITVKISGFKGTEGQALITLYDNEQSWLKVPKAVQVVRAKITGAGMTIELKDVKPGTYALAVVHDENKNNELDMRWLPYPKPKEGLAISNDPENKAGPPKFEGAKFDVTASGTTIKATLRYPE